MKIYLSGKISGLTETQVDKNFRQAYMQAMEYMQENNIKKYDCEIINPLKIKPFFGIQMWFAFMISDLRQLRKCDVILLQKNWIDSRGACIEHYFAKFIYKIKVVYL